MVKASDRKLGLKPPAYHPRHTNHKTGKRKMKIKAVIFDLDHTLFDRHGTLR